MKQNLEETYSRERGRLLRWMGGRIGREEAEDALHDVVVRSLVNLDSLEGVRDFTAWLWRAASNAVTDEWRRRRRRKALGLTRLADDADFDAFMDTVFEGPPTRVERKALLAALQGAIARLPPEQREVIVAQALRGETFRSIAERTNIPVETLAARKRYALARLAEALADFKEG